MPRVSRKPSRGRTSRSGSGRAGARRPLPTAVRRLVVLLALVLVAAGLWAARAPILSASARLFTIRDPLQRADAIVLLGGDPDTRPQVAARLLQRRLAPAILLVRAEDSPAVRLGVRLNDTDENSLMLRRLGVPATAIRQLHFPGGATSTFDEARAVRDWAYSARPRSIIVVTSSFHTRRARWLFRRQLEGLRVQVRMAPAFDPRYTESNWWRTEPGLIAYFEESLKFVHEWTRD